MNINLSQNAVEKCPVLILAMAPAIVCEDTCDFPRFAKMITRIWPWYWSWCFSHHLFAERGDHFSTEHNQHNWNSVVFFLHWPFLCMMKIFTCHVW